MIDEQTEKSTVQPVSWTRSWPERLTAYVILLLCLAGAWAVSHFATIYAYTQLDPRGSTLTSEALLQHHTLRLDGYRPLKGYWQYQVKNGHTYYRYPFGTLIFSTPFIGFALSQGRDMQVDRDDLRAQRDIVAFILAFCLLLIYAIFRSHSGPITSALLAGCWIFGTGIMSTIGAALWSIDFTVLWELLVVLILVRFYSRDSTQSVHSFSGQLCLRLICVGRQRL